MIGAEASKLYSMFRIGIPDKHNASQHLYLLAVSIIIHIEYTISHSTLAPSSMSFTTVYVLMKSCIGSHLWMQISVTEDGLRVGIYRLYDDWNYKTAAA